MKYLIDTNLLLWFAEKNNLLSEKIQSLLLDDHNEILVSAATLWEIAIKFSLGKLKLPNSLENFFNEVRWNYEFTVLQIDERHILKQASLPLIHRDPFDRMIYAQSIVENLEFLYSDKIFDRYRGNHVP